VKIRSNKLTICRVAADGETIELEFEDADDTAVTLQFPFLQAEAVAMTLPHLLSRALQHRTGKPDARYVFSLGDWIVEDTKDGSCLIVTLRTTDGFEVSFAITRATCRALGWSLQYEANGAGEADVDADEAADRAGDAPPPGRSELN
jgi:hypothetical protein